MPKKIKALLGLIVTAAFFALIECIFALTGVQPLVEKDPYVALFAQTPLFIESSRIGGPRLMMTANNKLRFFNSQTFPKPKSENTFRIFCMGGSTTHGQPYNDTTSFCGWLREFLKTADPSRSWEVINAGGISYASYRVAALVEELAAYSPDLFIVYAGHNEYLEHRTFGGLADRRRLMTRMEGFLGRTRTYSAVKSTLAKFRPDPLQAARKLYELTGEVDALLDYSMGPTAYHRSDFSRETIRAHFQWSLERMVQSAKSDGSNILFVVPASNLKDCTPFKSQHRAGILDEEWMRWEGHYEQGKSSELRRNWREALDEYQKAERIDSMYAELQYRIGGVLFKMGLNDDARHAYQRALEEDICPLRAVSEIRRTVVDVAERADLPLVDFERVLEESDTRGSIRPIMGKEFFLDHVHPTIAGHRLLALAILQRLISEGVVMPDTTWGPHAAERVVERVEGCLDRQSHAIALRNLGKVLNWAGKHEEAGRLAAQALEILPDDAESLSLLGTASLARGDSDRARTYFEQALGKDVTLAVAHNKLGFILAEEGRAGEAMAHYVQALRFRPGYVPAHNNLGITLLTLGRTEEALEHFSEALRIKPDYAEAYSNAGIALVRQGREAEAKLYFSKAGEIMPNSAPAFYNLGNILLKEGRYPEAARLFSEAIRIDRRYADSYNNLGVALIHMRKMDEAQANFLTALQIRPDHAGARNNMANLQLNRRSPD